MKHSRLRLVGLCLATLTGTSALTLCAGAGTKAGTNSSAATAKAAPQESPIPRSIFEAPKTSKEGRDPFFPNSSRPYGAIVAKTNSTPAAANLSLKALSGTPTRRLATINNVTFEAGEENEVVAGGTRIRVRVLEIKEDSVEIEVAGVRRVLRMRSGF